MKIWTVTTDDRDGCQTVAHVTEAAADAAAMAFCRKHWPKDAGPMPDDFTAAYDLIQSGDSGLIWIEEHDISGHPDLAQKPDTELTAAYRAAAKKRANDDLEFDDSAAVSLGDDAGAWVAAWVWVPESEIPPEFRDMED